jgi:hypothetical protein
MRPPLEYEIFYIGLLTGYSQVQVLSRICAHGGGSRKVCVEICVLSLVLGCVWVETIITTHHIFIAPDMCVSNTIKARSKESAYE